MQGLVTRQPILDFMDAKLINSPYFYCCWAVGNIQNSDVENGTTLLKYEAPKPAAFTGLHRYVS